MLSAVLHVSSSFALQIDLTVHHIAVAYRGEGVGGFKPPPPEIPKISVEYSIA